MPSDDDQDLLQEIADGQDTVRETLGEILEAVKGIKPVVNVDVPKQAAQPAPIIKVEPVINVPPATVRVEQPKMKWKFEITKRDSSGRIKAFEATPTS